MSSLEFPAAGHRRTGNEVGVFFDVPLPMVDEDDYGIDAVECETS